MNYTASGFFVQRNTFSTRAKTLGFYLEKEGLMSFQLFPSKKHPPLIPFVRYELEFTHSSGANTVKRLDIQNANIAWHNDPQRLAIAFFFCEVIRKTCLHRQFDAQAYAVLLEAEQRLNDSEQVYTIPLEFLNRWMEALGYLPEPLEHAKGFDVNEGIFTLNPCNQPLGAQAWNDMLQMNTVSDKKALKEAFHLMIRYLNAQVPSFDVAQTLSIIQQIFH